MAVAIGSITGAQIVNASNILDLPVTVAGSNRLLLVSAGKYSSLGGQITSVVADPDGANVALTELCHAGIYNYDNELDAELWYRKNPPTGTYPVRITWEAGSVYGFGCVTHFTGVHQTTTFGAPQTFANANNPVSVTITDGATDGMIINVAHSYNYFSSPVSPLVDGYTANHTNGALPILQFASRTGAAGSISSGRDNGNVVVLAGASVAILPAGTGASDTTMSGPTSGLVGYASSNFTVGANGDITGDVIITPSSGGGGGTFSPTTSTINTANPIRTFTYTAASAGTKTISTTNNGGLDNPTNISFVASSPGTGQSLFSSFIFGGRN